jgi:hypothetical protein
MRPVTVTPVNKMSSAANTVAEDVPADCKNLSEAPVEATQAAGN